jgi:hypothetical protein
MLKLASQNLAFAVVRLSFITEKLSGEIAIVEKIHR